MRYALTLVIALIASNSNAQTIKGEIVKVSDGDTFIIGTRIRLCGIDAPERGDTAWKNAKQFLTNKIKGESVTCKIVGHGTPCDGRSKQKNWNRYVAQCFIDGEDIAKILVDNGHAVDYPEFSGGEYDK